LESNWRLSVNSDVQRCLAIALWLMLMFAASAAAQPAPRSVLIVYSFDVGYATDVAYARAFRTELSKQSPEPINFFEVSLRPTPSAGAIQEEAVANYLHSNLADHRLDLVVTISAPAALFARKYRDRLFPTTPLLLGAVDQRWIEHEVLTANETVVPIAVDPMRVVEDNKRLRPETTSLIAIVGQSPLEQAWGEALRQEFGRFTGGLTLTLFDELSFGEMLKRSAALPANSAILYLLLTVDAKGFTQTEERVLAELHDAASVPLFGLFSHQMGSGIVGGPILSVDDVSRDTAAIAVRLLGGESAATINAPLMVAQRPMYDWRELQRWNISEDQLAPNSTILFRPPGIWELYRGYVLAGAFVVILQSALIAGLVIQHARRRRTEMALRKSEQQYRTTAKQNEDLAGRLITAQDEERTRIARDLHDDVSQQLAGVSIAVSGIKRRLSDHQTGDDLQQELADLQQQTLGLARNVRNLSHDLHPTVLQHLGLVKGLTSYCSELERAHGVAMRCRAEGDFASISPEAALCVYRIAQESLRNVIAHAGAKRADVQLTRAGDHVEITIVDDGRGFDSGNSAKGGKGLGLVSITERAKLAGGTLWIMTGDREGTRVQARIPA
jgi:signal transduction histidine kinase